MLAELRRGGLGPEQAARLLSAIATLARVDELAARIARPEGDKAGGAEMYALSDAELMRIIARGGGAPAGATDSPAPALRRAVAR